MINILKVKFEVIFKKIFLSLGDIVLFADQAKNLLTKNENKQEHRRVKRKFIGSKVRR